MPFTDPPIPNPEDREAKLRNILTSIWEDHKSDIIEALERAEISKEELEDIKNKAIEGTLGIVPINKIDLNDLNSAQELDMARDLERFLVRRIEITKAGSDRGIDEAESARIKTIVEALNEFDSGSFEGMVSIDVLKKFIAEREGLSEEMKILIVRQIEKELEVTTALFARLGTRDSFLKMPGASVDLMSEMLGSTGEDRAEGEYPEVAWQKVFENKKALAAKIGHFQRGILV